MESTFLNHIPCPACGSRDNGALYSDGHVFCFGCGHHTPGDGRSLPTRASTTSQPRKGFIEGGEVRGLPDRHITAETCERYGYRIGTLHGKPIHVAPYFDAQGRLVAQKIRELDPKRFWIRGSLRNALPFGAQAFPKTGQRLVVTEGEIDAMSVSQLFGGKHAPCVSIACGAGPQVRKYFLGQKSYFAGFKLVVLVFDADMPGQEAATVAAQTLEELRIVSSVVRLPGKDANTMLVAGQVEELVLAINHDLTFTTQQTTRRRA